MPPLLRELLIKIGPDLAGTAAGGLAGALLLALVVAACLAPASLAISLWQRQAPGAGLGRRVVVGMLVTILLSLAAEFAGDEVAYWQLRGMLILAFGLLVTALAALPIAWWRSRAQQRPPGGVRRGPVVQRTGTALLLLAAAILLGSTGMAALLKQRVHPEHLAFSAAEAGGLALVAAPFAWLLGRLVSPGRRGLGTLLLAATVALSGWLSLLARPLMLRQTTAAMQELASMVTDLRDGKPVKPRAYDRWRYGQCAPLVQGMSRFQGKVQAALEVFDHVEPVLIDESFTDAQSIRDTEARLVALRRRLDELDADVESSARELRKGIEDANISSEMRERILAGVSDGLADGRPLLAEQLGPLVGILSRLIAFMKARQGQYWTESSDLVFDLDEDAARYNELLAELEREKTRLQALSDTKLKSLRRNAEQFEQWSQDPFKRPRPPRGE